MDLVAIAMVLGAAVLHAVWNLLAKRSDDVLAFLWVITVAPLVIYAIPFGFLAVREPWEWDWIRFAIASAIIHAGYFSFLALAYERSDLSLAYPVARGTGLMLVPILAVPVFGDRPTAVAWIGIGLVASAILWLHLPVFTAVLNRGDALKLLSVPAFATGLTIAMYSLVDTAGVHRANPIVYLYVVYAVNALMMGPFVLRTRAAHVRRTFNQPRALLVGGAGSFGTYMIVLAATRLAPVSYVVPMRETSVVIGALLASRILGEPLGSARLTACVLVVAGVIAIGVGG